MFLATTVIGFFFILTEDIEGDSESETGDESKSSRRACKLRLSRCWDNSRCFNIACRQKVLVYSYMERRLMGQYNEKRAISLFYVSNR